MTGSRKQQVALIFDLDGVLVHSMPLHVLAWEEYLASLGIQVNDLEQRMHGRRNAELVRDLISSDLDEDVIFKHGAAKEQLFRDMLIRHDLNTYRIPGLLDFLTRHRDLPKAVASNAEPQNIDFVLDRFGLRSFFPIAVNGLQVSRPKPFPDIYLEAARQLQAAPGNCIVFEDSPPGLTAGLAAGMRVVGVESTPADLTGAVLTIEDFSDPKLEAWLAAQLSTPSEFG